MKYLGIDYGTKKIGLAKTDEGGLMAFPFCVVENKKEYIRDILKIIKDESIDKIILGKSFDKNGNLNDIQKEIDIFKNEIEKKTDIEIIYQNEIYSSIEAQRYIIPKQNPDAQAAAIILERYLSKIRKN